MNNVDHPNHYNTSEYECIDVMQAVFGTEAVSWFCLCNSFKYIWRCSLKNGLEDIKKARWYLDKYIALKQLSQTSTNAQNTQTTAIANKFRDPLDDPLQSLL